jgi:hypothetical protein
LERNPDSNALVLRTSQYWKWRLRGSSPLVAHSF